MNDLIGQTFAGRYFVHSLLGRGGMAEVYKVWDEKRTVWLALKLLREDLAQDVVFLRRFRREAETLSKLQHPNIVRFYGIDQHDRLAFILMDYVDGVSLRTTIFDRRGQGMSGEEAIDILAPMCAALTYTHHEGVVHCDMKPGNVMIHQNGAVLVSDFGIARMAEGTTATMIGAGTPGYMAPEQVRGEQPSPQTDIYALGVMLFEMLAGGERPFTGERAEVTGSTSEKIRWEQVHLDPPSLRKINPQVSRELDGVVRRCLAKEPAQRYDSVFKVLNAAQGALGAGAQAPTELPTSPPVTVAQVSPDRPAQVARPTVVRRRIPTWGWAGGALAVLVLFIGWIMLGDSSSRSVLTPTPKGVTSTTDRSVTVLEATITRQAILLPAPTLTLTIMPIDTPSPTAENTLSATQQITVNPVANTLAVTERPTATSAATSAAPTSFLLPGPGTCKGVCPAGLISSCDWSYGLVSTAHWLTVCHAAIQTPCQVDGDCIGPCATVGVTTADVYYCVKKPGQDPYCYCQVKYDQ